MFAAFRRSMAIARVDLRLVFPLEAIVLKVQTSYLTRMHLPWDERTLVGDIIKTKKQRQPEKTAFANALALIVVADRVIRIDLSNYRFSATPKVKAGMTKF